VCLVRRLARQVDGTAEVRSDHGTTWTLDFPVASSRASTTAIAKESATASFGMDR